EPRRPSSRRRLVQQRERHAVRGWTDAVALSQVRRARYQSRRVHDEHGRESEPVAVLLYTVAPAGVPDDASDGNEWTAVLRAAQLRSNRSQLRPDHLARGGPAR